MQAPPGNQTRIVSAATQCFIRKGFHATSMRDIAKVAGVSLGNIYNHFESKTELVLAIAESESAEIAEASAFFQTTAMGALPAIKAFMGEYLREASSAGVGALMIEIAAEASRNGKVAAAFLKNRNKICKALSQFLRKGQLKNEINQSVNCEQAAELIIDVVEGLAIRICLSGKKPSRAAVKEMNLLIQNYLGT